MPRKFGDIKLFCVPLHRQKRSERFDSECSAVGSALRSGRRGRAFESPHSDRQKEAIAKAMAFLFPF